MKRMSPSELENAMRVSRIHASNLARRGYTLADCVANGLYSVAIERPDCRLDMHDAKAIRRDTKKHLKRYLLLLSADH